MSAMSVAKSLPRTYPEIFCDYDLGQKAASNYFLNSIGSHEDL
jgi:hypothetical protein